MRAGGKEKRYTGWPHPHDPMPFANCQRCGTSFFREESEAWKRLCLPCWKKSKQQQTQQEDPFARKPFTGQARPQPTPVIDPEMMRRLLFLCHPDKHNNSEASQKATQWLLKIRG